MKLEHSTLVTSDGKKIVTGTWRTDSGQVTSQTIKSIDLKSGRLDIEGRHVETARQEFAPATSILGVGSKMAAVRIGGALEADAARKEPK
jgi:hypothetical protein